MAMHANRLGATKTTLMPNPTWDAHNIFSHGAFDGTIKR
jgi:hypothetical protein